MKTGIILGLALITTSLFSGCVWRGSHYDPDTGIVYGGGFDSFHRRWLENMRGDLRSYRRNRAMHRESVHGAACDDCWDHGSSGCGCGDEYMPPRRSRHYGRSSCGCESDHGSHGAYDIIGDEYFDGEYDGEYVMEGEMMHAPMRRSSRRGGSCPTCGPHGSHSGHHYSESMAREGWQEVSPNEYYEYDGDSRESNPPMPTAPPSSTGPREAAPVPVPEDGPEPSGDSTSNHRDARSLKWVPSRL